MINNNEWNSLHRESRFRPRYPEDDVVRWLFSNISKGGMVLDDGCGAGRHIKLLVENGYIPYGIDYSESGVEYTKSLLTHEYARFKDNIQVASCDSLPYEEEMFDGVISFAVLYYLEEQQIKIAIQEIYRVLKYGGKTLVVVRSKEDYRNSMMDEKLSKFGREYIKQKENNYAGLTMQEHFFARDEIIELFKMFNKLTIDKIIRTHENESYSDSDYIIFAEK